MRNSIPAFRHLICQAIVAYLVMGSVFAQTSSDSIHVLFIGNSFTVNRNTPETFKALTVSAKLPVSVGSYTRRGTGVDFFIKSDSCWRTITSKKWDYIVFQDRQADYYELPGTFPKDVLENNLKFQDSIKKRVPGVKIVYVAGWERHNGFPQRFRNDNTRLLINRILANYDFLNHQPNVNNIIAPVGVAWKRVARQRKDFYLIDPQDYRHPSNQGGYLYACVVFATIFMQSPVGYNYPLGILTDEASYLQKMAYQSVMDTISYTNLGTYDLPCGKYKDLLIAAPGYSHYQWYKNNTMIQGQRINVLRCDDPLSFYSVTAQDEKGAIKRSFGQYLSTIPFVPDSAYLTNLHLFGRSTGEVTVFPDVTHQTINMIEFSKGPFTVLLYDNHGKTIKKWSFDKNLLQSTMVLDVGPLTNGLYGARIISNTKDSYATFMIRQ